MPQTTRHIEVVSPGLVLANRFEVVRTIGVGSTGAVVEVIDRELDHERVALKLIHRHLLNDERRASRFRQEVLLVRQLSHPNIVRIFDFDSSDESAHFVTMELVRGLTLRSVLDSSKDRKLQFVAAIEVVLEILAGLSYAHARGVAHLDLKPENILLGKSGLCKLADFGLGNALEDLELQTRTGDIQGSPAYMAPEQFHGAAVGAVSDQYAVGVMAYEMVTGQIPFHGNTFFDYARAHREDSVQISPLSDSGAPNWFVDWIERALRKRPEDRFATIEAMKIALEKHCPGSGNNALLIADLVDRGDALVGRSDLFRRIVLNFVWFLVIVVIGFAALLDDKMLARYGADVLQMEYQLGRHLPLFRTLFGIGDISTLDPDSIFRAIARNDQWAVELWCQSGRVSTKADPRGNQVAHVLAEAPALLSSASDCLYPALFDSKNLAGDTPLFVAVRAGAPESVATLVQRGFSSNVTDASGSSLLEQAVLSGNPVVVRALFPNFQKRPKMRLEQSGNSILGTAVRRQLVVVVQELLDLGFDVEIRDADGVSPLMIAAGLRSVDSLQLIRILLAAGAQREARDHAGRTPVEYARAAGNMEAIALLSSPMKASAESVEVP